MKLLLHQRPGLFSFHVVLVGQPAFHGFHGNFCCFCKQITCQEGWSKRGGYMCVLYGGPESPTHLQKTSSSTWQNVLLWDSNLLSEGPRWGCCLPLGTSRPLWPAAGSVAHPGSRRTLLPHRSLSCSIHCHTSGSLPPSPPSWWIQRQEAKMCRVLKVPPGGSVVMTAKPGLSNSHWPVNRQIESSIKSPGHYNHRGPVTSLSSLQKILEPFHPVSSIILPTAQKCQHTWGEGADEELKCQCVCVWGTSSSMSGRMWWGSCRQHCPRATMASSSPHRAALSRWNMAESWSHCSSFSQKRPASW